MSAAAETAIGITISAVAMLLISWPNGRQHEQPGEQCVRPGAADDVDQPVGELFGRAGLDHRRRERDHPGDEDHGRPGDRRDRPARSRGRRSRTSAHAASSPATTGGTAPVASSTTITASTASAALRARAERHGLAAHQLGRVDDAARRGSPQVAEVRPRALDEQRVAHLQRRVAGPHSSPAALHGEHDQVAAVGDHAREDVLADEVRARRDHHLGDARSCASVSVRVVDLALVDQRRARDR